MWFLETGCPAVDKGANQPNVFVDPKSSETALPYFSSGKRDDLMQRRYLQALLEGFDPDSAGALPGANPTSEVYGAPMVDVARIHVYAWDARPYPAFPNDVESWGDGDNWRRGHWLTGRIAGAPLAETVSRILLDAGFADHDASSLVGVVPGYMVDRVMSPREMIQPLELAFFFDAFETGAKIRLRHRASDASGASLSPDDLVESSPGAALLKLTRGQETELPASAKVTYWSAATDYRQAVAEARRLAGASDRVSQADLAIVLDDNQAGAIADAWLFEAWVARERAIFTVPPSRLALEPSDTVVISNAGRSRLVRITEVSEHGARDIEARSIDPGIYVLGESARRPPASAQSRPSGQPIGVFIDLPLLRGDESAHVGYFAACQQPWPNGVALYRSPSDTGFTLRAIASVPATMGVTLDPLPSVRPALFDRATRLRVQLDYGELASISPAQMYAGGNLAAVANGDGEREVLQFQTATLTAPRTYELTTLLRGQGGTEGAMRSPLAAGARFVLLTSALVRVDMAADDIGLLFNWRFGPADRDLGHPTFRGVGLRPLSPVHIRGSRSAGDLQVSWIRRTRIGGDSWEAVEVPLGEDSERYEVDVLDGATVKRTLTTTTAAVTYTAADQVSDFGSIPSAITLRVYQVSPTWGRGAPRGATV